MANTENIEAKLAAYVDGELDPLGRAEIEQYLKSNPQHRALIDELRSAKSYLQELPRARAPMEVAEMISQQLERAALLGDVEIGADSSGAGHFSRWPQVRAIAAILLLTFGLAGVLYYVLPSPKPMSPEHVAIVTPDLPPVDDASAALGKARVAGPGMVDADTREIAAGRGANVGANVGANASAGGSAGGGAGAVAMPPASSINAELREQIAFPPSAQLCILVNTPDPARADNEVINYFASNQISYEHVASSEAIANGVNKQSDSALATTAPKPMPEKDNVAPGYAKDLAAAPSANSATNATTNPIDKNELAADIERKAQPGWPAHFKAKMTRSQAANMSETLSQSNLRQVAQLVSPDVLQQKKSPMEQQGQLARNEPIAPATSPSSSAPDAVAAAPLPAPLYADRTSSPRADVLAPGDTIRVRLSERFHTGTPITEETLTVDDLGYVELPRFGRVKAAGVTAGQLTTNILPQQEYRNRDSQAPIRDLVWSVEKIKPELEATTLPTTMPALSDAKLATTQETATAISATQPTTGPTTSQAGATAGLQLAAETEKLDVVVIVQNVPSTSTAEPTDNISGKPLSSPSPATTAPAGSSASTQQTTAPTR